MRVLSIFIFLLFISCSEEKTPIPERDQYEREDIYDPNQYRERRL